MFSMNEVNKTSFDLFIKVWWPLSSQERSNISLFFAIAQGNFSFIIRTLYLRNLNALPHEYFRG